MGRIRTITYQRVSDLDAPGLDNTIVVSGVER